MRVDKNIAAWRQLAAVEQDAARLREVHAPLTLLGRGSNNERIAAARVQSDAVRGLEQLTAFLGDAGAPAQAIDDAQQALTMLQRAPVRTRALQRAGADIQSATARIRATAGPQLEAGMVAHMQSLIETPLGSPERTRVQMIDTLRLAATPELQERFPGLAQLDTADITQVTSPLSGATESDLGARVGRVMALALPPAELQKQVAAAIHTSPDHPDAVVASFLATVAERDPAVLAAYPSLTPELLSAVASERSVENVVALGAALGKEHARTLSPEDLATAATATLSRPHLQFTARDAAVMHEALSREAPGIADRWPQLFAGMEPLDSVLEKFGTSSYANPVSKHEGLIQMTQYVGRIRAANMSPEARLATADEIFSTALNDVRRTDFATLSGILRTPERAQLHLPPDIPGLPTFDDIVEREMRGDHSGIGPLMHYLRIRRMNAATEVNQYNIGKTIAASTTPTLSAADWDTVYALTTDGLPHVPRPASWSPADVADARAAAADGIAHNPDLMRSDVRTPTTAPTHRLLEQLRVELQSPPALQAVVTARNAEMNDTLLNVSEALYEAAHGSLSPTSRQLLNDNWGIVDMLSTGLPSFDRLTIATTRFGMPADLRDRYGAEKFVNSVGYTLRDFRGSTPMTEALRSETSAIADRNIERMMGATPVGAVRGYGRHPDYAEVGEVRSGAEIIASAERMTAKAAAAQRSAARRAARASASAPATAPSDVIDW